ncbi:MAG: glutamate--tRNA ligase [Bacteroidales bacterium]|jgi:glutamyl-tRNA synthetase|nr:glutamate--tRNA ligase [Bacteroidales bacterium]
MNPRVRFAPSPTGPLHIGGVRTALYNYLFAKQHGGTFILRIEDTDQTRFVPGTEEYIVEAFDWLGFAFDEGVNVGGNYGPYKQSERKPLYKQYAQQLIDDEWAYYAFDTPDQLDAKRKEYEAGKKNFQYDCTTRLAMTNSLSLSKEETEKRIASGEPFVVRFKFPENEEILVNDLIRGEVRINSNLLDDKVLFKSDGMPTYHLANIVDDHLMEITHVIRGEEWLPSAPLHVMLYRAFQWNAPAFAHLPLLLKPDGNGKLSKRDGDRLGFPVFPLQWTNPETQETSSGYREMGYLPDTVINILALLGWNPGTEQEILSLDELIKLFSLDKISKSGAKFDPEKAKWFNHQYIQKQPVAELAKALDSQLKEHKIIAPLKKVEWAVVMIRERVNFLTEFWEQGHFLFEEPESYDEQVVKKRWKENTPDQLHGILNILSSIIPFDKVKAHDEVVAAIQQNEWNLGQVMNCLRLSLVGAAKGPDLFEIIKFIGVEETGKRVEKAIEKLTMNG